MKYTPDYKFLKAKKIVDSLSKDNSNEEHILYYITKLENRIIERDKKIKEFKDFFNLMKNFLR